MCTTRKMVNLFAGTVVGALTGLTSSTISSLTGASVMDASNQVNNLACISVVGGAMMGGATGAFRYSVSPPRFFAANQSLKQVLIREGCKFGIAHIIDSILGAFIGYCVLSSYLSNAEPIQAITYTTAIGMLIALLPMVALYLGVMSGGYVLLKCHQNMHAVPADQTPAAAASVL